MVGFAVNEAKPGPVQAIKSPGVGVNPELKDNGLQTQTGELDVAFNCGTGFTTTVVDPEHVAAPVAVTVYKPALATCAPGIVTDCPVAEKLFGPVQV
jgi:hypothetical protein